LLIEDFHSVIKEKQQLLTLAYDLSLAILIRKPFGYFGKQQNRESRDRAAPFEEEERLCCRIIYTHFIGLISLL
jgi:hypothetical protein